ncbi:MAG TPA: cation:proton antiporter, partial [Terriglobales bacterium]|nr:cation:proton antiporter [Terriglobales bacterium]
LGGLLALAFLANRLSSWTKVPDVVVLLSVGLLFGPVFKVLHPSQFHTVTPILGTLALILVLFEGGLELNLRETLQHFPGSLLLATLAYGLSMLAVWLVASRALHVPSRAAVLFGAVLGCTSSTVVLPILQQIAASRRVKVTLMLEASWGDVLAVLTVGMLINIPAGGMVGSLAQKLAVQILGSVALAVAVGALWTWLLPHLSDARYWQVLTFSVVLLLYAATESFGGNGLIAALAFGLTLSNVRRMSGRLGENLFGLGLPLEAQHERILAFHSELSFLVRTFFFVLIGVVVELSGLRGRALLTAAIMAALFLARWIAVQACRWSWKDFSARDRELVTLLLPRGLITVVLALQVVQAMGSDYAFLTSVAFAVILLSNLLVVVASVRSKTAELVTAATG